MNCHQILSGACNAGDRCFAIGSVEGIPFTAYAAGCNIVILASTFERVQIIPGAVHGYVKISALDCSTDTGKIAAAYDNKICIFEPTPILQTEKKYTHFLDYRWVQTGSFTSHSYVVTLSWNLEGTRLLTGGSALQLWKEKAAAIVNDDEPSGVKFVIGGDRENKTPTNETVEDGTSWENIWSCQTAIPIYHMAFSPDGTLFATCGRNDRLVKIWYENKQILFPSKSNKSATNLRSDTELNFTYIYIAHPRAVTNIIWRKTSKYMPKGSVSNMLVTSCLDNICRIWIETVLPDDGLINMTQFDPLASQNPKFRTHRHKHRFMQRLKHMKTCFHIRKHVKNTGNIGAECTSNATFSYSATNYPGPIPSLPSSCSVHDFHSYGYHGTGISQGMHFHLAASINAETDIPLVPSMQSNSADSTSQSNFILHWLNNKEMDFTLQAEAILQELTKKVIDDESNSGHVNASEQHAAETAAAAQDDSSSNKNKKYIRATSKSTSVEDNSIAYDESKTSNNAPGIHNLNSMSNTTSLNSLNNDNFSGVNQLTDSLDIKIDCLLRDWHQNPDLLFAIHPIDGSFLIWVVEWLDDFYPGSFRQAQVSFSTRIPNAFPLGDSMSMSTMVSLYNTGSHPLVIREIANNVKSKEQEEAAIEEEISIKEESEGTGADEDEEEDAGDEDGGSAKDKAKRLSRNKSSNEHSSEDKDSSSSAATISTSVAPSVSMVTKHSNGSLNLWQLSFAYKTRFTQVLSIGHVSRVSGHRFRVNDINCHPVLPLLVSTSHHNLPEFENKLNLGASGSSGGGSGNADSGSATSDIFSPSGFCSELILWRVDAVGPLCHSGGVSELARINSPEISAFSNVAWIPTLLPSTTLGSYSNSPSACFVASDGENLRVYQAVIDARTLLAEISSSETITKMQKSASISSFYSTASSTIKGGFQSALHDKLKVVSQQSTARPGCIIQLDAISDAKHDWQNTQFLHVFQAQLITGAIADSPKQDDNMPDARRKLQGDMDAIVDLQRSSEFEEPFYIVIIEKTIKGSTIHMWRIVISSKQQTSLLAETEMYVPDYNITQDVDGDDGAPNRKASVFNETFLHPPRGEEKAGGEYVEAPHIAITTEKVCTQELPLPDGVDVIHASPSAGHLSSSSIYPACYAPYIIVTACSDSISRFWRCEKNKSSANAAGSQQQYVWSEWKMFSKQQDSAIEIPGQPLNISAAYSGRVACAYKYGKSFTRPNIKSGDPDSRYINLCVAIYECESTGGSKWILEDTIHLRNIHLPRINVDHGIDLSYLHDNKYLQKKQRFNQVLHTFTTTHDEIRSPRSGDSTPEQGKCHTSLLAVPSFSTLQSLRKSIAENGNTCPLTQKHLVQLDWVSKEDGSHILTVAAGSKILLYTPVSSDIAQANIKAMKESRTANRPILRKASSLAQPHFNDEIRWMKLRQIDLQTADGLPPLPMQISWVRDGIIVVAMDSEMHVYSQWKPRYAQQHCVEDLLDTRNLRDEDLRSIANESSTLRIKGAASMPLMSKVSTANLQLLSKDKKSKIASSASVPNASDNGSINDDYMTDFGLFQASRIACPVLPQYHPKQLMELLNCGKIRWVKAILAHLVRCLSVPTIRGNNEADDGSFRQRSWSRSRTLSISYAADANIQPDQRGSTSQITEELMLDYAEITSIPPLPLWVLLNADKETTNQGNFTEDAKDYDQLFEMNATDDNLDDLLDDNENKRSNERRSSLPEKQNISHFGLRQGQVLSRLLTHTHLPGLSSLDQMHLLALADTVSTCNTDFSDKFIPDSSKSSSNKDTTGNALTESLDDCGLRFLLAMKHFSYLLRCLPLLQRTQFQKQGIGTSNIVWAFHSESEEELLNLIPSYTKGDLKWATLRDLGVGYWLRNINILRQCVEKLAKCAYQSKQDPLDAALYYLAMKKKSIVWGLFRSKRDQKMTTFFANNFSDDRWRKAALKNAFVLLGKQRFDHAVAFFLLANSLHDAIEVCINKLEDFQLALVIARLYEGDLDINAPNSTYRKLLCEHVLGSDSAEVPQFNIDKAHPDPFLRSMTFWIMKKYQESLSTLLLTGVGQCHVAFKEEDILKLDQHATNPNVFNFYIYLRTHPLLVRQNLAISAQEKKIAQVVLSGFSYSDTSSNVNDKQLQIEDTINSIERQLYFTTAHGHFKAGCPALALEVLNKLPMKVIESNDEVDEGSIQSSIKIDSEQINTGIITWGKTEEIPQSNKPATSSLDFDWGAPVAGGSGDDEFKIEWDDDKKDDDDEEDDDDVEQIVKPDSVKPDVKVYETIASNDKANVNVSKIDIMAQQLKFIACLKILMEELSTLATGFEVDGGQLRYQLYIWLEKEVEALQFLCNYCNSDTTDLNTTSEIISEKDIGAGYILSEKPTLHEILMHEKQDFEAKVIRAARRKKWLKANEALLRTFLSYCSLHGASGGGLASVRMELVLLLQELQQEKTQQQLLSPLPFPTTLPLLSACVAGNKTVIADPIKYLQSQTIDMLQSIIKFTPFAVLDTNSFCEIFIMRDLAVALSSCIYQSLCDSETFLVNSNTNRNGFQSPGIENIAKLNSSFECSHLIGNTNLNSRRKTLSSEEQPARVCTTPSKWPGVANLRALLAREKDEDIPKLNVLLLESFIATYVSLVTYALVTCDSRILYRLVAKNFSTESWSSIFGGGTKKLLRKATTDMQNFSNTQSSMDEPNEENSVWNAVSSITKQRVKLNMKILGNFSSTTSCTNMKEDKPTFREQFVSPEMSMLSFFLSKPTGTDCDEYDTDDPYESENEEDEDDDGDTKIGNNNKDNKEHVDPLSYSWCIVRLAALKIFIKNVQDFVNVSGIELQDLPVLSPLAHEVLRTFNRWQDVASKLLASKDFPNEDYFPESNSGVPGLSIHKYRSLLNKDNTPFITSSSAGPIRRLWNYLVRQEQAQDVFIKAIFAKKSDNKSKQSVTNCDSNSNEDSNTKGNNEPIRIIHKDHESILSFCLNNNAAGMIAVANPREVQELDISLLLENPNWYEDECDYDILNLSRENESGTSTGFLMIQSPEQSPYGSSTSPEPNFSQNVNSSQSGRGTDIILKHKIDNVKRMSSHPLMPLYLTGGQDGSVQIWEWGHQQVVCTPRPSGTFAKVTRCKFSEQGNKFGIGDGDGNLSLWQAGIASQNNRPFFTYQCHNKTLSDFAFLGSCSLLATAGQSSENKNIIIWDTLLPQKKSCVCAFTCHDQGSSCFVFAPQHQLLISCGKKGDICVFDMRQRILKHRFQGHENAIKCISLDPHEEFFATGSIEGDIKIWSLHQYSLITTFSGEHAKNSFFKHIGQGVAQITIDAYGRLFSCGSDGCMKVRQLFEKDNIVHSMY